MFLKYNLFTFLWAFLILLLSFLPSGNLPYVSFWDLISFDKAAHTFVYAVLSFITIIGFIKQYTFKNIRYNAIPTAFIGCTIYGGVIELLQGIMNDRVTDFIDFFANFIGCILGLVLFLMVYNNYKVRI